MPVDGFTLHLLTAELRQKTIGSRIEKIHQPGRDEFVFHLRSRQGANKLLISASSSTARINLTSQAPENPGTPPMLCMFMRKHLTGCIITDITQYGLDRIVFIDLKGTNEIGDAVSFRLAVEIMAKHSNFVIIGSDGIILEAAKKADLTTASVRQIQPGFIYKMPPARNKADITAGDVDAVMQRVLSEKGSTLSGALLKTLEGASPLVCREIACRVTGSDTAVAELGEVHIEKLNKELIKLRDMLTNGAIPTMLIRDGKPFDLSFMSVTQYGFAVTEKTFPSFSELIDGFYSEKTRIERTGQQSKELQKMLANLISRSKRKLETRKLELENCKDKDKYRIFAELILSYQYNLEKGVTHYEVENYYDEYKPLTIPADPALSPAGNAAKYFKEYNKLKTAEKLLGGLIEESETEIAYLESVLDCVTRAGTFSDIAQIKEELSEEGYLRGSRGKKQPQKALPPLRYESDDGYAILVGRNNIQNETLTFKTAAKDDSWFHVQSFPGSHVVVIGNGDILPEETCRQAAVIAACNSAAADSSRVAVDYTEIREIKKIKGGKKGMVIYHTYNTMWVTPDRELCERLEKKQ